MTAHIPASQAGDLHRPRFHLTAQSTWLNDPNGLIFHGGMWHAFFQNNPSGGTWGNISWGHAVSADLATWQELPVALPCSDQEMIFSGSVVHDVDNSSGLGRTEDGSGPLVALYTSAFTDQHPTLAGLQAQSVAYSLDHGDTWSFYAHNPVLSHGSQHFRDPKVFFHTETQRWVMVTVEAVDQCVHFHTSQDLLTWVAASTFTEPRLTGELWECPDLLRVPVPETATSPAGEAWVLIVSTNPGGPAGGSGNFAVVGDFDGERFTSDLAPQPLDLGPDCYAAVSFSGVTESPIILGWMNNWSYAEQPPTSPWRSSMTLPRRLSVVRAADGALELRQRLVTPDKITTIDLDTAEPISGSSTLVELAENEPFRLQGTLDLAADSRLVLAFGAGAERRELSLVVQADRGVVLDRSKAHVETFAPDFTRSAPYLPLTEQATVAFTMVVDRSCVEVEFDHGRALASQQIFPGLGPVSIRMEHLG